MVKECKKTKKRRNTSALRPVSPLLGCGAGGSRTRVQTYAQYAFYMCIPLLDFGNKPEEDKPTYSQSAEVFVRYPQRAPAYPAFC